MSAPFGPYVLTLSDITRKIRETFEGFVDPRTGQNSRYTLVDAALSAFSVFFMQSPSFLEYQRCMEQSRGENNVQGLFGVHEVPTDNQIRNLLDATPPEKLEGVYAYLLDALEQAGILESQRCLEGRLLAAFDGTTYFSSQAISCPQCSQRQHAHGKVTHFHTVVTPVLVKPGSKQVIPLVPEFVRPQDGAVKQDCELNASKRWLETHGADLVRLKAIILGDDLYCHAPFCRESIELGLDFILVCKPGSHVTTYEWLESLGQRGAVSKVCYTRWTGKRREYDTYRYARQIPLCADDDALRVNWCELVTTDESGKVLYSNAFVTRLNIEDGNVAKIVEAGRCRWKIENENNNTLKTGGYHFEHNYGHGHQHLSSLLASLIILAFLTHTVLEWMDANYRLLRAKIPSRRRLFNDIQALTCYLYFENWEALMMFMLKKFDSPRPPAPATG